MRTNPYCLQFTRRDGSLEIGPSFSLLLNARRALRRYFHTRRDVLLSGTVLLYQGPGKYVSTGWDIC